MTLVSGRGGSLRSRRIPCHILEGGPAWTGGRSLWHLRAALADAAAAFLAQPSLARSTRRSHDQTLTRLVRELGGDRPLSTLTVEAVTVTVTTAWGGRAPATWNRQVAAVRSFLGFCRRRRWLVDDLTVDLERRPEPADRTQAIPLPELEQLWRREDVAMREKALWRLLYETAARASEALSINVEDLDLDNKRVRVRSKGGDTDWLHFQSGSARLLPRLIAGRTRGATVPGRAAPGPRSSASHGRSLPGDRPGSAELPARPRPARVGEGRPYGSGAAAG